MDGRPSNWGLFRPKVRRVPFNLIKTDQIHLHPWPGSVLLKPGVGFVLGQDAGDKVIGNFRAQGLAEATGFAFGKDLFYPLDHLGSGWFLESGTNA
jgi:hypothetical protein